MNICSQLVCGFFILFISHFTFSLLVAVYKEKKYYWAELRLPYWWGHPEQSQLFMTPLGQDSCESNFTISVSLVPAIIRTKVCTQPTDRVGEKPSMQKVLLLFSHVWFPFFFFKAHLKWNSCRTWSLWLSSEVTIGVSIIIHVCIQRRMGHIFTVIFKRKSWQRWEDAFSQYATNYFSRTSSAAWFYILQGNFIRSHRYGNK